MNLIDRYVRAVGDNLPRGQRDDILRELTDSIHSRFEDEEATLGRPLVEAEEVAILRAYGHPMAVAARYRGDDRSVTFGGRLIGPELFPTYMKVLTANVVITLLVVAIIWVAGENGIVSAFAGAIVPIAIQFSIVTAIFVWIDRRWIRDPEGWDPRTVNSMGPDVDVSTLDGLAVQLIGKEHTRAVAVTTSVLEFGLLAIVLTIWLAIGVPDADRRLGARTWLGGRLSGGDRGHRVRPAHPGRQSHPADLDAIPRRRARVRRRRDASSSASGRWPSAAGSSSPTRRRPRPTMVELTEMINTIVRISVAATVVLTVITTGLEFRRLVRMRTRTCGYAGSIGLMSWK